MIVSRSIFPVFVIVLLVFVNRSHGIVPAAFAASADIAKIVTSQSFLDMLEASILAGNNSESLTAQAAINDVRDEVKKFSVYTVNPLAVNASIDGILGAIKMTYALVRQANEAIETAISLVRNKDLDGALNIIQSRLKSDTKLSFIVGVKIYNAQGFALALAGSSAMPGLAKAILSIDKGGNAAYETLRIANELVELGIVTGGKAAEVSLRTAQKVISTGSKAIYANFKEAATHALEGMQLAASKDNKEENLASGIIECLKTEITTDNPAASNAVDELDKYFKSVSSVLTKKVAIDAANLIHEGIRSTILKIAEAINILRKALEVAENKVGREPAATIMVISNAVNSATDKVYAASANVILALGSAGLIAGKSTTKSLIPDLVEIETGIASVYQDLELGGRVAAVGIHGDILSMKDGIKTAFEICDAAGILLFQDFIEGGKNAFEALKDL